jgi:hypothetical protein
MVKCATPQDHHYRPLTDKETDSYKAQLTGGSTWIGAMLDLSKLKFFVCRKCGEYQSWDKNYFNKGEDN